MIVDSSVIVAILAHEAESAAFLSAMSAADVRRISAASVVELTIVLSNKREHRAAAELPTLLNRMNIIVEPVSERQALLAREAFLAYGKGRHRAKLNFGDTFSYALAKATGEPLLFKGDDFILTDIIPAV